MYAHVVSQCCSEKAGGRQERPNWPMRVSHDTKDRAVLGDVPAHTLPSPRHLSHRRVAAWSGSSPVSGYSSSYNLPDLVHMQYPVGPRSVSPSHTLSPCVNFRWPRILFYRLSWLLLWCSLHRQTSTCSGRDDKGVGLTPTPSAC